MGNNTAKSVSRRQFLKTAGATALAAGAGPAVIIPGRAQPKTLRIARIVEFVPSYVDWLEGFAKTWGEKHDIQIVIDWLKHVDFGKTLDRGLANQTYDLVTRGKTLRIEDHVINHRDIYVECERLYGKPARVAAMTTYNPKSDRFSGVMLEYLPWLITYRKDLWDGSGYLPDTWENIRLGGRKIKFLHEYPVGIGLNRIDDDAEMTLSGILYSFGGSEQDENNRPALKSKQTLEAIKFVKSLYEEAMTEEVLEWDAASNNRFMLSGEGSLTSNPISIVRTAENKRLPIADSLRITDVPRGPIHQLMPVAKRNIAISKHCKHQEKAIQFVIDYIGNLKQSFLASQYYFLPSFPGVVPDLSQQLANDNTVEPSDKYQVLANASQWATHPGYPGHLNAAFAEVAQTRLTVQMFVNAASGKMPPEEAMTQADQEVRKIYDKWRALGKV